MAHGLLAAPAAALAALLLAGPAPGQPRRIVSINPCIDAVLLDVADPGQIAAISHYSHDPRSTSLPLGRALRFRATSGTAEEVVALRPDLVLAGGHVAPATIAALARLGVPVRSLPVPASLADARAQVQAVAAAAGQPARGAALLARIDAAISAAQAAARRKGPPVPALIWQGGGLVPGAGTLADDLLRASGFRNASADYGLNQWDVLPLEHLAARPPRLLFSHPADRMTRHPVLAGLAGQMARAAFPDALLRCAGPSLIPALAQLSRARQQL